MEDSGFGKWWDKIEEELRAAGYRVTLDRDRYAVLLGEFWDGVSPARAIERFHQEGRIRPDVPLPNLRRNRWMK